MARQLHDDTKTDTVREIDLPDVLQADPDVTYEIRPLTTSKFRELQKKNTRLVVNKATKSMEPEVNAENMADDLIDHVVAGWTGIVSKGQPADCTRENKMRLDGNVKSALIAVAGMNKIDAAPAAQEASFRPAS